MECAAMDKKAESRENKSGGPKESKSGEGKKDKGRKIDGYKPAWFMEQSVHAN